MVFDKIGDALTHLLRNSIDHGIESPEERAKTGKSPIAKISLVAQQNEDKISITLSDDGKGLDREKIFKTAIKQGLISTNSSFTDQEMYSLIFKSGFSTKDVATDISGRGVGMNVVQRIVEEFKGKIDIVTEANKGTSFKIELPLSFNYIRNDYQRR